MLKDVLFAEVRTTYKDKNKWGVCNSLRGSPGQPICGRCYSRANWKKRFVPIAVKCDQCSSTETTLSKYGTPKWVKNKDRDDGYFCWSCHTIKRNTGIVFSQEEKQTLKLNKASSRERRHIW